MSNKPDYYQILGVEQNANQAEIKEAYRFKVSTLHPDRVMDSFKDRADDEMKKINIAYEILGDPKKKEVYDLELDHERKQSNPGKTSIEDRILIFFSEIRRKELLDELEEIISKQSQYYGQVKYTSQGFIAGNYFRLADKALPGKLYVPGQIAINLREPQADVEAAFDRLIKTPYIYNIIDKYGATPKYFSDHSEIYNVKEYGLEMQERKNRADQIKRINEANAKQAEENARKAKKYNEEKQYKKELRRDYSVRMVLSFLSIIFLIFAGPYSNDSLSSIYIFLLILFFLLYMVYCSFRFIVWRNRTHK